MRFGFSLPSALDGLHHLWVGVAHELASESGGEVQERVAVDIREASPETALDHGRDVDVEGVADHP